MNLQRPKIYQIQTKVEKGFIEELTDKVRQLVCRFGQIPLNVQQILNQEFKECQDVLEEYGSAQIDQYFDPVKTKMCPNIWQIRLRAQGIYDGKEFVGWLVFPQDYPASWPTFCLCYPKQNNLDKTNDQQRLAFQHANIYQSGEMSILAFEKEGWYIYGPKILRNVDRIIGCIIGHPNYACPANQPLAQNSEESKRLLIQQQLRYLNDYPSRKD